MVLIFALKVKPTSEERIKKAARFLLPPVVFYITAPENAIMQIIVLLCHRDLLQEILGLYIKNFRFFLSCNYTSF